MQYKKLTANIHTTNLLVDQLIAKPAAKNGKKKRTFLEKKPQTDFINSPKQAKDTRQTATAFVRDSSISHKDENARTKSVNMPSYYKGGSA